MRSHPRACPDCGDRLPPRKQFCHKCVDRRLDEREKRKQEKKEKQDDRQP